MGRCRDVCPHLFDLSAGQGRPSEESWFATTIAHPKETLESVSMDYISGLPKVGDLGTIIVVVDRLSKYATFIAAPKHVTAEGTAHLFFKHVVKYWGLPKDIKDWVKLLDVAQLCFNAQKSSSTNKSAFEIVTGATAPPSHSRLPQGVRSPLARSFSQEWKQNVEIARSCLEKAQKRMKKYADKQPPLCRVQCGRPCDGEGPDPRLSKSSRGRDPRLMQKYVGPLPIIKRIGTVAYKIELPSWWKIHSVFHVSQLKKYSADKEDAARNQPSRPKLELTKTKEKVAEAILNHRVTSTAKRTHNEYLVKWKGCSSEENTWERVTNLKAFLPLVEAYHASHAPRTSPSQVGGECQGTPALSAPLTHIRPRNRSTADQQPSPQTLDFRSLRVLGVGLLSCKYC
ncbi:UNVERIFIED_CONTAM: Transposon Ty3-G Gag-Pol polyprotein [Sesamum angustifolium]|uniref:Transposon Ty3-G Gag-Pol polyprotein n=1 Tax=Sesamum angustifolium TaxID=2727405 RepID=A0AAW2IKQ8_9LAMI